MGQYSWASRLIGGRCVINRFALDFNISNRCTRDSYTSSRSTVQRGVVKLVVSKLGILLVEVLRRNPKSVLVGIVAPSNRGADTYPDHLDRLKGWLCFTQQASARSIFRQHGNCNRFSKGARRGSPEHDPADPSTCSAQGSAQVRAVTAPVQRQKQTLVREVFVAGYIRNLKQYFFTFASNIVSHYCRSAQALLTLASPSAQVTRSRSCSFQSPNIHVSYVP